MKYLYSGIAQPSYYTVNVLHPKLIEGTHCMYVYSAHCDLMFVYVAWCCGTDSDRHHIHPLHAAIAGHHQCLVQKVYSVGQILPNQHKITPVRFIIATVHGCIASGLPLSSCSIIYVLDREYSGTPL